MYASELNTPQPELDLRIKKLQDYLRQHSIDAALILQRVDLFYFSGTFQQGSLYIPADGDPILMVNKSSERARAESGLAQILRLESPKKIPGLLKANGYPLPRKLGLELDVLPTNMYFNYQRLFQKTDLVDLSQPIRLIRAVKSVYEISIMRRAAELSDRIAGHVPHIIREGMSELELAGKVEAEARKLGHQGVVRMRLWGGEMFYGHLMSGPTGAVPSYLASPTGGVGASPAIAQGPGYRNIQRHEPLLVDYVFAYNGYLSDHTRIFSLGSLPQKLVDAQSAMLEVQAVVKKSATPGVPSAAIYELALAKALELGYADHFMGAAGKERIRFVGHGIGLEIDEYPFLAAGQDLPLQEGMTIAVEPKLIFPGEGVVGIENTHVVRQDGLEQLGRFPEEIFVI
ncbi:MAG: Xaa-Pro peptidase family protein [Desulfobacteraceae bacterium]|jgi:Xaa-Pro aminopeptidase|nr:Xaa-Pro peptidase family protein [Desulfobacteraceae bacterium]